MPQGTLEKPIKYLLRSHSAKSKPVLSLPKGAGFFEVPYSQCHASAGHKSIPNINLGSIAVSGDSRQTVVQF